MTSRTACALAVCACLCGGSGALAQTVPPPSVPALRLAIEDQPAGSALQAIDEAGKLPIPVAARVESAAAIMGAALEARIAEFERRSIPIWLAVPAPSGEGDLPGWRQSLRAFLDRHDAALTILEVTVDAQPARVAAFAVQTAATEARSNRDSVRIALGGPAMTDAARRAAIYSRDLSPYINLLAVPDGDQDEAAAWLQQVDPLAELVLTPAANRPGGGNPVRGLVDALVEDVGTQVTMRASRAADTTASTLVALAPLATILGREISRLDPAGVQLTLSTRSGGVTASLRHRLLFDTRTFATHLVYWGDQSPDPLDVSLTLPVEGAAGVLDLLDGTHTSASGYRRDQATGRVQVSLPLTGRPMLVDFNEGAAAVIADRSDVSAVRDLSVGEIVARHQQQQRGQDGVVRNYIAHARMEQHFRPTVTDPGYDVATENRYFVAGDEVEWEELSFSVNGSRWGADRPGFPLLQPEKVLSLPLQLRFDEGYRYELGGTERVDGFDCFVVRFEPVRQDASLYRGTVWIDSQTFGRVRVQAVQSGLVAPVVSNEEIQRYALQTIGNRPVFLFGSLTARQIILIAGRNILLEKRVEFTDFRVDDPDFVRERDSAREGDRIMYRETDRGLRYFLKEGGVRVVSERPTSHAKALAMGVMFDPSYAFPLPIVGIDYLNFQFGSPDTQLAILFGGVLAAGNVQRSKLGGTPLDASVDFFAIAVPSSDRLYRPSGEADTERVLTWPLSTGLNLGWQATPFQKAIGQYQFRFDGYIRDAGTADTFTVPASTVTHGIGGAWEYRRGGYSLTINGTWFTRARWTDWGALTDRGPETAASVSRTYAKYGAGLSRDFYFNVFQKIHLNAAWFSGRDLDRFGKYQFGLFDDTRVHGVPSSGVRFGELAMARGSYSLNILEQYRLDLFVDQAWGRGEPGRGPWQSLSGYGAAVNVRAPWSTILRVDFGKSLLPSTYAGLGSTTVQVLLLKPLR